MQLEFLSAANGLHLTKSFTASSSSPYPLVTNVTSHSFSVTSLEDFYDVLCSEAYFGHSSNHSKANRAKANQTVTPIPTCSY